jgi:hypothetical protein
MDGHAPHCLGAEKLGLYANHFNIGHNAFEVILHFGQYYEGESQSLMHTRIITCPAYAKTLMQLLEHTLAEYESSYGPISVGSSHE